mgnify:CR=1 FL=1
MRTGVLGLARATREAFADIDAGADPTAAPGTGAFAEGKFVGDVDGSSPRANSNAADSPE